LIEGFDKLEKTENTILMYFIDLDLYCVFTYDQYADLMGNINQEMIHQPENIPNANIYQVVLSNKKQKLVFACGNQTQFDRLQKYAKDCFKKDIQISGNQLTIDIIVENDTQILDNYNLLYRHIMNSRDADIESCTDALRIIPTLEYINYKYRNYSCTDTITASDKDELLKLLRSHVTIINVVGNNNIVGDNNAQAIGNNNVVAVPARGEDKKEKVIRWITNNPPNDGESTKDYYNRFIESKEARMYPNQFGPIVSDILGRKSTQGTHGRHW
jgi:hypothetical protein